MSNEELPLARVIINTVRYFNLFDQPVTAVQLWRTQIGADRFWLLTEVRAEAERLVQDKRLQTHQGFYFLPQRDALVRGWLRRHVLVQQKWKLTQRIVRRLQYVPFVRMIAMSGSLAAGNTRATSDLDLFVIVKSGRIWLARSGLLTMAQVLGRRRRHWDQQAPDKVCLNHYVTDTSLSISPDIHNIYTAVLYQALISLTGHDWQRRFLVANQDWMQQYVRHPQLSLVLTRHVIAGSRLGRRIVQYLETMLAEPLFDWLEAVAERLQRRVIIRHTEPGRAGRVVMTDQELAFHPNTKVPALLKRYYTTS